MPHSEATRQQTRRVQQANIQRRNKELLDTYARLYMQATTPDGQSRAHLVTVLAQQFYLSKVTVTAVLFPSKNSRGS